VTEADDSAQLEKANKLFAEFPGTDEWNFADVLEDLRSDFVWDFKDPPPMPSIKKTKISHDGTVTLYFTNQMVTPPDVDVINGISLDTD